MIAQVEEVPAVAAHNAERPGLGFEPRIEIARDELNEGGFARAVGAEDGYVLALRDGERDAIEHDASAAFDGDVLKVDQGDGWDQGTILTSMASVPSAWVEQLRQGS